MHLEGQIVHICHVYQNMIQNLTNMKNVSLIRTIFPKSFRQLSITGIGISERVTRHASLVPKFSPEKRTLSHRSGPARDHQRSPAEGHGPSFKVARMINGTHPLKTIGCNSGFVQVGHRSLTLLVASPRCSTARSDYNNCYIKPRRTAHFRRLGPVPSP